MKSPREVLIRFGMEVESRSRERKVNLDQALSDLAEIVRGERKDTGNPVRDSDYNDTVDRIAKLFEAKD